LCIWTSNTDKAILYNNLARLYLLTNDFSGALKANKIFLENISTESFNILPQRQENKNFSFVAENKNKIELISF